MAVDSKVNYPLHSALHEQRMQIPHFLTTKYRFIKIKIIVIVLTHKQSRINKCINKLNVEHTAKIFCMFFFFSIYIYSAVNWCVLSHQR